MPPFDPSGISLERQGLDTFLANQNAQRTQDYGLGGNVIDQAVHMTGPLPDPQWQAFFQALQNRGVSKITPPPKGSILQTSPGSNQLTGASAQPDYFTGGGVTPDALGQSVAVLKNRARPLPEGHDVFMRRLMANDPQSLTAAGVTPTGGS